MSEALLARLLDGWSDGPWVLATVLTSRGATPRKAGAMMCVGKAECFGSVGGGEAEARVQRQARAMLSEHIDAADMVIDLGGGPGAAGICGGQMRIGLRKLGSAADRRWVQAAVEQLQAGRAVRFSVDELGAGKRERSLRHRSLQQATQVNASAPSATEIETISVDLQPNPRLLIVGGGHCGVALYQLAQLLDFDIWLFDERPDQLSTMSLNAAHCLQGDFDQLALALDTPRPVYAVLLTRNFQCDIAALRVLARKPPAWTGMMGSRKRVREVVDGLPELIRPVAQRASQASKTTRSVDLESKAILTPFLLAGRPLMAPVGIEIGAESPAEIALAVLAQVLSQIKSGRFFPPTSS